MTIWARSRTVVAETGNTIRDLLYPPSCNLCGTAVASDETLCRRCSSRLPRIEGSRCEICSMPYDGDLDTFVCLNCNGARFAFGFTVSAYRAAGDVRELIHRFKYGRARHLCRPLGELMACGLTDPRLSGFTPDALVPVPLHPVRERERGFNQSQLLADELRHRIAIPVRALLRRSRYTRTQTEFTRNARMQNLRGAFNLVQNTEVEGKCLLLVDDVFTTGSTLHQCARVLVDAGAAEVNAITVARG